MKETKSEEGAEGVGGNDGKVGMGRGNQKVTLDLGGASRTRPVQQRLSVQLSFGRYLCTQRERDGGVREGCGRRLLVCAPVMTGGWYFHLTPRMAPGTKYSIRRPCSGSQYGGRTGGFGPEDTSIAGGLIYAATNYHLVMDIF